MVRYFTLVDQDGMNVGGMYLPTRRAAKAEAAKFILPMKVVERAAHEGTIDDWEARGFRRVRQTGHKRTR